MASNKLYLYATEDVSRFDQAHGRGGDIEFPKAVHGWTEVLDCRSEPYTSKSLAENCDLARRVRKKYILVGEEQIAKENPTA